MLTCAREARAIPSAPSRQAGEQHHPPGVEILLDTGREGLQVPR
jgi:hypothetical protein